MILVHFHFKKEWEVGIGSHFGKSGPISSGRLDVLVERNIACQAMEFLTAPWKRSSAKFSKFSTQNVFFF